MVASNPGNADGLDLGVGGWPTISAAQFAEAARQSRRARRLRYLLPAAGCLLLGALVVNTVLSRIAISLSIGDLKITAEGLAMDAPRLSGSDGKGRTYTVTAKSATQDLTDTRIIRLGSIAAHVKQADDSYADFSADSGIYDAGAQKLTLDGNITIRGSDGSEARLAKAVIDVETGAVESDAPVAFSSNLGRIEARGMDVTRKGGSVTFGGGVKMTIDPKAARNGTNPLNESQKRPEGN